MRFISFGNLYIDYYFNNSLLLGICGGKSNANILANLSKNYETKFIGIVGNDIQGNICIDSLKKLGVNVDDIKILNGNTKKIFINPNGYSNICPYCGRKDQVEDYKINYQDIISKVKEEDILIIDELSDLAIDVINNTTNRVFLDLKYLGEYLYYSLSEIEDMLKSKFEIINMSERVYHLLRDKFKIDSMDIYELLNPSILIINRGKKGMDIIYNCNLDNKEIEVPIKEVDISGSSDAFFSEFINNYMKKNCEISEKNISYCYMKAIAEYSYVSKIYGARTHLEPLYKVIDSTECICKNIEVNNK